MERLTIKCADGRWALANNDKSKPLEQMEKLPIVIDRLAVYEDAMPIERAQELAQAKKDGRLVVLPNAPLTLDELREMDGIPVFVTKNGESVGYALVNSPCSIVYITCSTGSKWDAEDLIDEGCKFYRRKPEEEAQIGGRE